MFSPEVDPALIPAGEYCYRLTGETVMLDRVRGADGRLLKVAPYASPKREVCPYWGLRKDKHPQESGHCRFLGQGDWEREGLSLLWDQVKECGVNLDETDTNDKDAE